MKYSTLLATAFLLAACGTDSEPGKPALTKNDKFLTCDEILLEINDAKFLRDMAARNKGASFKNIVWPVGYVQTYSSAEEAIHNTNTRIAYLSNIYAIKRCDDPYPDGITRDREKPQAEKAPSPSSAK